MQPPERLATKENLAVLVTFRLTKPEAAALRALAKRAGVGHATFCRLAIGEYIKQHGG